jgi:beta-mannosidase
VATLDLFAIPESAAWPLAGDWRLKPAHYDEGYELGYANVDFADSSWEVVQLPHLRHATAEQDTLWYRHSFNGPNPPPKQGQRTLLRFGGAFYRTHAWLNGVDLGNHEGYFQPFGFDVTDILKPTGNLLAVRCRFPVEAGAFKRKTAVAGIFTDWDCKPYPSQFYPDLPAPNEWTVPVGLWQPVSLQTSGQILIESFNILPKVNRPDWEKGRADSAEVQVVVTATNLAACPQTASLQFSIDAAGLTPTVQKLDLAANERREVTFTVTLTQPALWFPWTHGKPFMYQAHLEVSAEQSPTTRYGQAFGVREIKAEIGPGRWEWQLNGRRVFLKGSNYVSDFYLDRVTFDGLLRDVELAKGANLDLLRVHGHIAPLSFYRLCDELGLLVMCDFPLIWTYGFNLSPEDDAAFRASVQRQVGEMIRLLGSHPSISLWSMHNEPPWTPDGSFLGSDVHDSETNRRMDESSAALVQTLDPTRPVVAASGVYDQHLYHGWYTGGWQDNHDLHPTFPTEFGVQALPGLHSPFWATVNHDWPISVDDPTWAHSGYQSIFWTSPGVGAPAQYHSLTDYVAESQAYQAFFLTYCIDQWRRQKFDPTGGYIHFLFTDGWPAITWAVLDYYRLPKQGYQALAAVSNPAHVCLDYTEGFTVERAFHLVFRNPERLKLKLWLVNDDYRLQGSVTVMYWIEPRGKGLLASLGRSLAWMGAKRPATHLPKADERAQLLPAVDLALNRSGDYSFRVQVWQGTMLLDESTLDFRVGETLTHEKAPRHVPGLLVNRVYVSGSLRHTNDGFTFSLRNPAMPVMLQFLVAMKVDGDPIDPAQIEIVSGGSSRHASSITPSAPMEIPSGKPFAILVRGQGLTAGQHVLDVTIDVAGVGELSAQLKDKLI